MEELDLFSVHSYVLSIHFFFCINEIDTLYIDQKLLVEKNISRKKKSMLPKWLD